MRFNPNLEKSWFGALMEIINNVTMLSIILTGAALIREREHGTIEHLLVMPVTPTQIMLAKVWSMGAGRAAGRRHLALHLVVRGVLQVPVEGSMALFIAGCGAALPVRHHVHGHLSGHHGPLHAAVRHADGADPAAAADCSRAA
jgi:ABC-2 type transport system permease protein